MPSRKLDRQIAKLRKRGWSDAKIERWVHDKRRAAGLGWEMYTKDVDVLEALEQLVAKYRPLTRWGTGKSNFDLWLDHRTTLKFIDDAEASGLIISPCEFAELREGGKIAATDILYLPAFDEALARAFRSEGRAAAVHAAAQMTRDYIRDGFPDDEDVMCFWIV